MTTTLTALRVDERREPCGRSPCCVHVLRLIIRSGADHLDAAATKRYRDITGT